MKFTYPIKFLWTVAVYTAGFWILSRKCHINTGDWWPILAGVVLYGGGWLRGIMGKENEQ